MPVICGASWSGEPVCPVYCLHCQDGMPLCVLLELQEEMERSSTKCCTLWLQCLQRFRGIAAQIQQICWPLYIWIGNYAMKTHAKIKAILFKLWFVNNILCNLKCFLSFIIFSDVSSKAWFAKVEWAWIQTKASDRRSISIYTFPFDTYINVCTIIAILKIYAFPFFTQIYVTMDKSSDRNRLAMIINNVEFRKTEYNRRGAEKDEESMRTLLDALGYDAIILNDLSAAVCL